MADRTQLSPGGAVVIGLLFAACGLFPILLGLGVLPAHADPGVPPWLVIAAGMLFVQAGALLIVSYAIARVDAVGNDPPGTPLGVRVAQYLLGLSLTGTMLAMFAWIAFGRGERHFSYGIAIPFFWARSGGGALPGRIAFGIAAVLIAVLFAAGGVAGAKQLRRSRRDQ